MSEYYVVVLDVETSGLDYRTDDLVGVGVYCPSKQIKTYHKTVEYTSDDKYVTDKSRRDNTVKLIHDCYFSDPFAIVVMHNAKFDCKFLDVKSMFDVKCKIIDSALLYHIVFPDMEKNLDSVAQHLLNRDSKYVFVNNPKVKHIKNKHWRWPAYILSEYCLNDCELTYLAYEKLLSMIIDSKMLSFAKYQHKYLYTLYDIEILGISINSDKLIEELNAGNILLTKKEIELLELVKKTVPSIPEFNYRSSKQLSALLYDELGIEKASREEYPNGVVFDKLFTKTLTNKNLLGKMGHEIPQFIVEIKKLETVIKYFINYQKLSHDGKINPQFNLTGTVTGRLSCSKPNLQNIGKELSVFNKTYNPRSVFVASPGYKLVSMDYKQQEIRMLAVLSQDTAYLEAMSAGVDMHEAIATSMFPQMTKEDKKARRTLIKNLHFG